MKPLWYQEFLTSQLRQFVWSYKAYDSQELSIVLLAIFQCICIYILLWHALVVKNSASNNGLVDLEKHAFLRHLTDGGMKIL